MKIWVERIVTFDHMATDKTHFHVRFFEEDAKYHRSCDVIVFVDKDDPRSLQEQKQAAIGMAKSFIRELTETEAAIPTPEAGYPAELRM